MVNYSKSKHRIEELDFMRSFAIISVLTIHSANRYANSDIEKLIGNYIENVARPCIAIFLFISGYLLSGIILNKHQLKNRLKRVIIPYIFFSFLAFLYRKGTSLFCTSIGFYLHIARDFLIGNSFGIYYFVFVICAMYIMYYYIIKININIYKITLIFGIITVIHVAYYNDIINFFDLKTNNLIRLYELRYVFWPFFFLLGVLGQKHQILEYCKKNNTLLIYLYLCVFIVYSLLSFISNDYGGYNSVIGTLYAIFTILLLMSINIKSLWLLYISKLSYYLYLSHIFIVYLLIKFVNYFNIIVPYSFSIISLLLSLAIPILIYETQKKIFNNRLSFIIGV
jgi:surface polysaccharide O-acyltransferase-like enzyme